MNIARELFGDTRLLGKIQEAAAGGSSPKEVIMSVSDALISFADGAEQSDDITMLALRPLSG
jgi:sigma-B regulation protein RsbU (phosphoserine phosphatase)